DIRERGVRSIICLGDVGAYGPEPEACLAYVLERCSLIIRGNGDGASEYRRSGAAGAPTPWPLQVEQGELLFVHGSARDPLREYVFPEDASNEKKLTDLFRWIPRLCFQGHTHLPGVFTDDFQFATPAELGYRFSFDDRKAMINVGSVGQPRDGDLRACYVLFDPGASGSPPSIEFRRVEFDVEAARRKPRRR
ncbi:MAG TPA: metallophosphoesterase family protein, partial [Planctomycetia bacterium]|nr:metallophosphoesterase family protein [Planctomycetia bacterium]